MSRRPHTPRHLKDLTPDPENRRRHTPRNLGMIVDALHQVGAARSIVIDEDGQVLAGNGVVDAAAEAGLHRVLVVDADGETLVAVRRRGLTRAQKRQLAIYDNRSAELATWDTDQLRADFEAGADLSAFFVEAELDQLLGTPVTLASGKTDPEALPALRPTSITAGDLFAVGAHRVLCGDSTKADDVARVLGEARPTVMVTDPPYGVAYDPTWRDAAGGRFGTGRPVMRGTVPNDTRVDWTQAWQLFPGDVAYVWHAARSTADVQRQLQTAGFGCRAQIVWVKPHFILSRGHYHWQHEPCWYAVRKGRSAHWIGDRSQSTVWDIAGMNPLGGGREEKLGHGTQKPIACMRRPLENHDGDVYDPFGGVGTTLMAAEQLTRRSYVIEIAPPYVQATLDRWEAFTGQQAVRVGSP